MPAYLIAFIQPTDKAFAEYPPLVPPTLEPYSGKIILKCLVAEEWTLASLLLHGGRRQ